MTLPACLLGKTVSLNNNSKYIIKYQEPTDTDNHVILFEDDRPKIYALISHIGQFKKSFFLNKTQDEDAIRCLEQCKKIESARTNSPLTQADIKDALNEQEDAKFNNKNLEKLLMDEHLQDIKNRWPSRLLSSQSNNKKSPNSLIHSTLIRALATANTKKAIDFLLLHRYDPFLVYLHHQLEQSPSLMTDILTYYNEHQAHDEATLLLTNLAKNCTLSNSTFLNVLLDESRKLNKTSTTSTIFKQVFLTLYQRGKREYGKDVTSWLSSITNEKKNNLKRDIMQLIKDKKNKKSS
ncbi:hypothetical protein BTR23_24690 [Alkalihalophilus pseudofirmus]|uniref:hypothetical protein n=1 Tax=Alkalihalobacterium alkalinitrilicum TaxID=427920 RepID=UPI00094D0EFC|nr:hypothetical protein [Alkalihalobacterium alkalinitrilicum]OLO25565.1 hypothetical protein BTR23_24690 [Alkalihalophilus pseudofirmus]